MSSGSGDDEFYDAQDVTPVRQNRLLSASSLSEGESLLDLEKEERRLLEQKKIIEERRRQEEEEIQRKLASLDRKKQKEIEKKEAARIASENDKRRRKLEEMRLFMSDESTPDRPAPLKMAAAAERDVPGHERSLALTKGDMRLKHRPINDDIIEEKLEALSFELEQSGHLNRGDFSRNKSCDIHRNDSIGSGSEVYFQSVLDRTVNSFESDCFEDAAASDAVLGPSSRTGSCNKSSSLNSDLGGKQSDLSCDESRQKSSSLPVQLSVYPCETTSIDLVQKPVLQEPDIIQSTKSLPRQQPPATSTPKPDTSGTEGPSQGVVLRDKDSTDPVVPPRKKKSQRSSTASEKSRDSGASRLSGDLDHLSVTGSVPIAPVRPGGYRPSLDLSAATQGSCHVVATEESAIKGDNQAQGETHMDALKEEDLTRSLRKDDEDAASASEDEDEDNLEDDEEESLDVLVHREDSVVEEPAPGAERESAIRRPDLFNLARQKSKTLGGSASEELRKTRDSYSGSKVMTDKEILEQVMVTNLDTGEKVPLSDAENHVPPTMNPLSLHIMRLTKEYSSDRVKPKNKEEEGKEAAEPGKTVKTVKDKVPKKRGKKIKKFLSKSVRKIKELKSTKEDRNSSSDDDEFVDGRRMIKIKASHSHKGPYDFDLLVPVQNLAEDSGGAVWTMKFSHCGRLLATGGQDNILKIWVLKSGYAYFDGMRQKYSEAARVSPTPSQDSQHSLGELGADRGEDELLSNTEEEEDGHAPFMRRPFCVYKGHTADLLDVSWSKNYFILSSSMDKTVRLWHVSRKECLCCFQHIDFVTAIAFHPKDDRYFLSGSLDGKLRLWSIPEKKVALWNEVSGQSKLITAANFCTDGKIAVGTYDGRCVLYTADHLDYYTQIHVRSTRGKNAKGGKITGVDPYPGENKILVTSNDSRVRLYDLRDKTLTCKYKGPANSSSRIKASFNHDGGYIICGSEDGCVYIWRTQHDFYKFYSVRRDRNDFWEGVKAHVAVVTAAIFAPEPSLIIRPQFQFMDADDKEMTAGVRGEVVISADFNGAIKVFINKFKPGSG